MESEHRYRRFLVVLLALYLISIPFNVLVDPFGIFGGEIDCFTAHRDIATFNRMTTVHDAERADAELIVMGSSRVAAFDAEDLERVSGKKSYVLMVAATDIYELRRHFEHIVARKPIRRLLLGLDYYAFNPSRRPYAGFDEARLQGTAPPLKDYAIVATHYQALSASAGVVRACLADLWAGDALEAEAGSAAQPTDISAAIAYAQDVDLYDSPLFDDAAAMEAELDELRALLALADEKGIEVTLYTSPIYFEHWLMIWALRHDASFLRWKRSLVELGPVWDFVGGNSITRERANFSDTAHYHEDVARMMVRRMFEVDDEDLPADFGVLLTPENVDARLDEEVAGIDRGLIRKLRARLSE